MGDLLGTADLYQSVLSTSLGVLLYFLRCYCKVGGFSTVQRKRRYQCSVLMPSEDRM